MKKYIALLMAVVICFTSFAVFASGDNIKVYLDGKRIIFETQPRLKDNEVIVPMEEIFEALGAGWSNKEKSTIVNTTEKRLSIPRDADSIISLDKETGKEKKVPLSVAPIEIDSRCTLIPINAIAKAFDFDIIWNAANSSVILASHPDDSSKQDTIKKSVLKQAKKTIANMTTEEFDKGMARGIMYFNEGDYTGARDAFQWFCDSYWGAMNEGQQEYALGYLDSSKRIIQRQNFEKERSRKLTTTEFDNGMKKGINYFNKGNYLAAEHEFQSFCDNNWGHMNSGQQNYALGYLNSAKSEYAKDPDTAFDIYITNLNREIDEITNGYDWADRPFRNRTGINWVGRSVPLW